MPRLQHDWQWRVLTTPAYCTCGLARMRGQEGFVYRMSESEEWSHECPPCARRQHRWKRGVCTCGAEMRFSPPERPSYRVNKTAPWTLICPSCTAQHTRPAKAPQEKVPLALRHVWQPWKHFTHFICKCGAEKQRLDEQFVYRTSEDAAWSLTYLPCTQKQHDWKRNVCSMCGAQVRFDLERPAYRMSAETPWVFACPPCERRDP